VGDLVKLAGSADTDGTSPTVIQAAAGNAVVGAVVGFAFDPANLNLNGQYRVASTNRYVLVADDPSLIFEAQTSNDATPIAATDVGLNVDFAVAAGSTNTGKSGMSIDMGTEAATSTLPLKIVAVSARIDNELAANAKVLVSINLHQRATGGTDDGGVQDGVIGV
jgi:hypothetical protein